MTSTTPATTAAAAAGKGKKAGLEHLFVVGALSVSGDLQQGQIVAVAWKVSAKAGGSGETTSAIVGDRGRAEWADGSVAIRCVLVRKGAPGDAEFERKHVALTLFEPNVRKKDDVVLGRASLDLATVAAARQNAPLTVNLAVRPEKKAGKKVLGLSFSVFAVPADAEVEAPAAEADDEDVLPEVVEIEASPAAPAATAEESGRTKHRRAASFSHSASKKTATTPSSEDTVTLALRAYESSVLSYKKKVADLEAALDKEKGARGEATARAKNAEERAAEAAQRNAELQIQLGKAAEAATQKDAELARVEAAMRQVAAENEAMVKKLAEALNAELDAAVEVSAVKLQQAAPIEKAELLRKELADARAAAAKKLPRSAIFVPVAMLLVLIIFTVLFHMI